MIENCCRKKFRPCQQEGRGQGTERKRFSVCAVLRAPPIDANEEEQPHGIDELPVPHCGFKAEVLLRREISVHRTVETDAQKDRADDDMKP